MFDRPATAPPFKPRVAEALTQAIDRTTGLLFKPFRFKAWLALGLCAFLTQLSSCQGTLDPIARGAQVLQPVFGDVVRAMEKDPLAAAIIALTAVAVALGLCILLVWLGSRGRFMMLDNAVFRRAAVAAPWRDFARLANDLTVFRLVWTLASVLSLAALGAISVGLAWPDIQAQAWGSRGVAGLIVGGAALTLWLLVVLTIHVLLADFIPTVMYLHDATAWRALELSWTQLVRGHVWLLTRFYLLDLVLRFAIYVLTMVLVCLTCCVGALPYISAVLTLPLFVFRFYYPMCLINQYGPAWQVFPAERRRPACARCGYDLRGSKSRGSCPECGEPFRDEQFDWDDDAPVALTPV